MRRIAILAIPLLAALLAGSAGHAAGTTAATPQQAFEKECGACHWAFAPQFLPARSWKALLGGLEHHFGENASLDPATTRSILSYLVGNAADAPGRQTAAMRGLAPGDVPLRITETPFWRRRHDEVSPDRFHSASVKSPSNCLACHRAGGGGGDSD